MSVVLPVYNGLPYLHESIESVLRQTLTNIELIVVDDGSIDGTADVLAAFAEKDPRVRIFHQSHQGVTAALNRGLEEVRAPFVARIDADDLALPDRLAVQVAFMKAHPRCGVLGGAAFTIGLNGEHLGTWTPPDHPDFIRWRLMFGNCLIHPTVLFRTDVVRAVGGYDESAPTAQDYVLWVRLMNQVDICSLPMPVGHKRQWEGRLTRARNAEQEKIAVRTMVEAISSTLGRIPDIRPVQYLRTMLRPRHWDLPPWRIDFTSADAVAAYDIVANANQRYRESCRDTEGRRLVDKDTKQLLWRITRGAGSLGPPARLTTRFALRYPRAFGHHAIDKVRAALRPPLTAS